MYLLILGKGSSKEIPIFSSCSNKLLHVFGNPVLLDAISSEQGCLVIGVPMQLQ